MATSHRQVTFTLDLEDHRPDRALPKRYPAMTRRLLAFWRELDVRATVFVVGTLARDDPDLIKEIAAAGHEIAFHSLDHTPLPGLDAARFRRDTADGKKILEDLTGRPVIGFRAPVFSLTSRTVWAVEVLGDLGFRYSSSVLAARNPLHGYPGAPATPFRWPNGLVELPVPTTRLGPFRVPFLGGIYLRYLPSGLIRRRMNRAADGTALWIYCHPYDFDPDDPGVRIKGASWTTSILLKPKRRNTFEKLRRLLRPGDGGGAPPFAELVEAGRFDAAPVFQP